MKREDLKGQVFKIDGKPLVAYCKFCGGFTLDTETVLCAACRLQKFLTSMSAIADRKDEKC